MSSPSLRGIVKPFWLIVLFITCGVTVSEAGVLMPPSIGVQELRSRIDHFSPISPTSIACNANIVKHCLDSCYTEYGVDPRNPRDPKGQKCQSLCHMRAAGC